MQAADDALTARQRTVMTAVAIYKTLHDARRKLRAHVGDARSW